MGPLAIASAAVNVVGAIAQGGAEYQQNMADSYVAGENANRARMSAANARLVGQVAEKAKRREVRKSLGRSAASVSQAGIGGPGYGSAGAMLKQAAAEGEFDARSIRYDAGMEAYGYELDAADFEMEKRAARRRARGAKWGTAINVASAALDGRTAYSGLQSKRPRSYGSSKVSGSFASSGGRGRSGFSSPFSLSRKGG